MVDEVQGISILYVEDNFASNAILATNDTLTISVTITN